MPEGGSQEQLPHVRGHGQLPRVLGCDGTGTAERSYPASEARGGSREEQPHTRGQGQWLAGAAPRGCMGAEGPRGAIPH